MDWLALLKTRQHFMKMRNGWLPFLALLLATGLGGCGRTTPGIPPTLTLREGLTPYWTATPSRTPRPLTLTPTSAFSPTPTPTITPTPFIYTIKQGDTLGALGLRYGVSVKEIEAANPGVNARLLVIGQKLVIPLHPLQITPTAAPTSTPPPVALDLPTCYPSADGGLWCLATAHDAAPPGVENLSARLILAGPQAETLGEQIAIPALNLLPAGQSLPLAAFFPPPLPAGYSPQIELLTALRVAVSDTRYLSASASLSGVEISVDGLSAASSGEVLLPAERTVSSVWVLGVAYDAQGVPVGLRKLETTHPCAGWEAPAPETTAPAAECRRERLPFTLTVYSLGPAIAHVEVLVEARP